MRWPSSARIAAQMAAQPLAQALATRSFIVFLPKMHAIHSILALRNAQRRAKMPSFYAKMAAQSAKMAKLDVDL